MEELTSELSSILVQMEELEKREKQLRTQIQAEMEDSLVESYEDDYLRITYIGESLSHKFNSGKFKKDYPTIYSEYCEESTKKPYIMVKVV